MTWWRRKQFRKKWGQHVDQGVPVDALEIVPRPTLVDPVPWGVFERACDALGVSPDDMMQGRLDAVPERFPISRAEAFLKVVLTNSHQYDFKAWPVDWLDKVAGYYAGVFFYRCSRPSPTRRLIYSEYAKLRKHLKARIKAPE